MNTRSIGALMFAALILLLSSAARGQTLADKSDCQAIGGNWDFATQPPQVYRCVLTQFYQVQAGQTLEISVGVELELAGNGVLRNDGQIVIQNTGLMHINHGLLDNQDSVYADNRAEIVFTRGQVNNNGSMSIEGDITINNTWQHPMFRYRECWYNNGTLTLFSGGNLFNLGGCIDTFSSGVTEVLESATMIIGRDAIYRTRGRHTLNGRVMVEAGGFAELSSPTINGLLDVQGAVTTRRGNGIGDASATVIAENGTVSVRNNGMLTVDTAHLQVDGEISLDYATLRKDSGSFEISAGGSVIMNHYARVSTSIVAVNNGFILRDCFSVWDGPNPVGTVYVSPCKPVPIRRPFFTRPLV